MKAGSQKVDLARVIELAAGKAFRLLFATHPGDYYYCSLVTTGEALPPCISAWSREALAEICTKFSTTDASSSLKWSYADSPFYCFGDHFFESVRSTYRTLPKLDTLTPESEWHAEVNSRLMAMEVAMSALDAKGLFGRGLARAKVAVLVEVAPPDSSNTERAFRLNPEIAIADWLAEAAE